MSENDLLLEINNTQGIYPITNLRFLEAGTNNDTYGSDKNFNINEEVALGKNEGLPISSYHLNYSHESKLY